MASEPRTNKNAPGELMFSGTEDAARTGYNAEATTPIRFGVFVALAATVPPAATLEKRPVTLPASATSVIWGVCKRWFLKDTHPPKDQVAVYHRGNVGVYTAVAIKVDDPVFAIFTPGPQQGFGTNAAGANAVAVPNARWVAPSTGAGEVAVVSLNLP